MKKKQPDYRKYSECLPRCSVCKNYEKRTDPEDGTVEHCCWATFNQGKLIFRETLDICNDNSAFEAK